MNAGIVCRRLGHRADRLGLVVLNTDQAYGGIQRAHHDAGTGDDLVGLLAHQCLITGDVGLALGAVDDQGIHRLRRIELDEGREGGAALSGDAGGACNVAQHVRLGLFRIREHVPVWRCRGIAAVSGDHHAARRKT